MTAALILAAAIASGTNANAASASNDPIEPTSGRQLYTQYCASCHGNDLRGGPNGPTLRGAGAAGADFWISTGRMPAAVPWIEEGHRGVQPYLSPAEASRIVTYVAARSSGPAIPLVFTNGHADRGRMLFEQNCEHCHGVDAGGASIGGSDWAPSLDRATIVQVAEAIRIGPGEMPQFGGHQIDDKSLDDIATYLSAQRGTHDFHGLPTGAGGPVPEGLYGWLAAGALSLIAFGFWSGDRKKTPDDS